MQTQQSLQLLGRRYQIQDALGQGGMGTVYRAVDKLTGQTVALKQVTTATENLVFASRAEVDMDLRLALAHEFKTLASLRHPNIISVLDYGFDSQLQPFFTMNLIEQPRTILEAGRDLPVAGKVGLLVQMLQALAYLHHRRILHRDLKPGNVLVEHDQVKVLDFGLAISRDQSMVGTSGTIAYMAPEVLDGDPSDERADLYATGVIAYEMFVGKHPFGDTSSIFSLLKNIKTLIPDVSGIQLENTQVALIIDRLLSKRAAERYNNAGEVIKAYHEAIDLPGSYETVATRESFLQAAEFVGREQELKQLTEVLDNTKQGHGTVWLVAGEGGMGKSRLVNELRTKALVDGVQVLRGQAQQEGGRSYQIWREGLHWLVLTTALNGFEAGVLKSIVPDITDLLDHIEVHDAQELDPQATQDRLLSVVETLLRRQQDTTLFLLEDLHWAGSESLTLLTHISRVIPPLPILILGSYRDNERPDLPTLVENAHVLNLSPLSQEKIAELSASMIGSAGRHKELIELLARETAGNVFFLIEVVRTLAEEVGHLSDIGIRTLPVKALTGGIAQIIERRIGKLPADVQRLLRMAALIARQLDIKLLAVIDPQIDLTQWLQICSEAGLLDSEEDHWRFAHDKFRENIIARIDATEGRAMHLQIANAYEQVYSDNKQFSAILALHWKEASNEAKEGYYSALAGQQALENAAYIEAITLLNRAIELRKDLTPVELALYRRHIAQAHMGLGQFEQAGQQFRQAILSLEQPDPFDNKSLTLNMLGQLGQQISHRMRGVNKINAQQNARLIEEIDLYELLSQWAFLSNSSMIMIYCTLHNLNLAERIDRREVQAGAYSTMAVVSQVVPLHGLANTYATKSRESITTSADPLAEPFALIRLAIYESGRGNFEAAIRDALRGADRLQQLGALRMRIEALVTAGTTRYYQGNFAQSFEIYDQVIQSAEAGNNVLHRVWGLGGKSCACLYVNDLQQCIALGEASLKLMETNLGLEPTSVINRYGVLSTAYLRSGNTQQAKESAAKALAAMDKLKRPVVYSVYEGYAQTAETYFALWDQADPTDQQRLSLIAKRLCNHLHTYRKRFKIGEPAAWRFQGLYEWKTGKQQQAMLSWQKSFDQAKQMGMAYDEALACYQIGAHLPADDPKRQQYLNDSAVMLNKLGAVYAAEQAKLISSKMGS